MNLWFNTSCTQNHRQRGSKDYLSPSSHTGAHTHTLTLQSHRRNWHLDSKFRCMARVLEIGIIISVPYAPSLWLLLVLEQWWGRQTSRGEDFCQRGFKRILEGYTNMTLPYFQSCPLPLPGCLTFPCETSSVDTDLIRERETMPFSQTHTSTS